MHIYISTQIYKEYMFAKNTYTYIYYVSTYFRIKENAIK